MTKLDKQMYMEMPSIGYYSGCGGIEVKTILYGIDDYVIFIAGAWTEKPSVHKAKIYYSDIPYFRYNGYTIHFYEVLRMEV